MSHSLSKHALYTREETAQALRVSIATLDNWVRAGRGPTPTRLNGRVLFREAEIERFLVERTARLKAEAGDGRHDMATLIASDLLEREPCHSESTAPFVKAVSDLLDSVRTFDLAAQAGKLDEESARLFVRSICVASRELQCFGEDVRHDSLACDVHAAAVRTAAIEFPDICNAAGNPDD